MCKHAAKGSVADLDNTPDRAEERAHFLSILLIGCASQAHRAGGLAHQAGRVGHHPHQLGVLSRCFLRSQHSECHRALQIPLSWSSNPGTMMILLAMKHVKQVN